MALGRKNLKEEPFDPLPNPDDLKEALNLPQSKLEGRHHLALAKGMLQESVTAEDKDENGNKINGKGLDGLPLLFAGGKLTPRDCAHIVLHHHKIQLTQRGQSMSQTEREQTIKRINEISRTLGNSHRQRRFPWNRSR